MRKRLIAVIGAGRATAREKALAREVGRLVARRGAAIICGGLGGVMEAACAGAEEEDGISVGLLPNETLAGACPSLSIALTTGLGEARNYLVATSAEGVIAVGGALGTLSELAFAIKKRLPVATLRSWPLDPERLPDDALVFEAPTPEEAVEYVFLQIAAKRDGRGA